MESVLLSLTNGGRSLNAVWHCKLTKTFEVVVMQYLASRMDFRAEFTEHRWESQSTIGEACRMHRLTVGETLRSLVKAGYLRVRQNPGYTNQYALTDKVFDEYRQHLEAKAEAKGGVMPMAPSPELACSQWHQGGDANGIRGVMPMTSRTPSGNSPKRSSLNFTSGGQKLSRALVKEAKEVGSLIFSPADPERYVDRSAIHGCMEEALRRYGIEAIRAMKEAAIDQGSLGSAKFVPAKVLAVVAQFAAQIAREGSGVGEGRAEDPTKPQRV